MEQKTVAMKKQHKIIFGKYDKSMRKEFCQPDQQRVIYNRELPKPPGYTGI